MQDAQLLLGADALLGHISESQTCSEEQAQFLQFATLLISIAAKSARAHTVDEMRCAINAAGILRRQMASELHVASLPGGNAPTFGIAGVAWLGLPPQGEEAVLAFCERALHERNGLLGLMSRVYTETENSERAIARVLSFGSSDVHRIVRRTMLLQTLSIVSDHVLAAGVAESAADADVVIGSQIACERAARGRADAFACQRLYNTLALVIGLLMMGAAAVAEAGVGSREKWHETQAGIAVLEVRQHICTVLHKYDTSRRATSAARGSGTYVPQTTGCVAVMQHLMADIFVTLAEDESMLLVAMHAGMGAARLFVVDGSIERVTFWQATAAVHTQMAKRRGFVGPTHAAAAVVAASIVFASDEPDDCNDPRTVRISSALYAARAAAMQGWPRCDRFYGREWRNAERKTESKLQARGRTPYEVGEDIGYRIEWANYLAGKRPAKKASSRTVGMTARLVAALRLHARASAFSEGESGLPAPNGSGAHRVHAASLQSQADESIMVRDRGTETRRFGGHSQLSPGAHRTSHDTFRMWAGGLLLTDLFPCFFEEVWVRFNDSLLDPDSEWAPVVESWRAASSDGAGNSPACTGKLMHPWRMMLLQKEMAGDLLAIRLRGDDEFIDAPANVRAARKLATALLQQIVQRMAYAPFAGHVIRRFCPVPDAPSHKRRRAECNGKNERLAAAPQLGSA